MSLLRRKRGLDSIGLRRPTRRVALAIGALDRRRRTRRRAAGR